MPFHNSCPYSAATSGFDYSGAETAEASLKGIRVYAANPSAEPEQVLRPTGPQKYWSRRALAGWILEQLSTGVPAIVGIDHAFSFLLAYFKRHGLPLDWPGFLNEFRNHRPTNEPYTYVDFVPDGMARCWSKVTGGAVVVAPDGTVDHSRKIGLPVRGARSCGKVNL